jgi:hypothetical protein
MRRPPDSSAPEQPALEQRSGHGDCHGTDRRPDGEVAADDQMRDWRLAGPT